MTDKDVARIYREMELMLIDSMKRNLALHTAEESLTKLNYPQWQAIKLKELRKYQKENKKIINRKLSPLSEEIAKHLREELEQGYGGEISKFRKVIGERRYKSAVANADSFFKINTNKVNALIEELNGSLRTANHAVLRMANDTYRDVIAKAGLFVSNGVMTEQQAIDMALKDFLSRGLNCIEYKDGRRVNIADYASMAVRTANQRAYMAGEGEFRKEIGNPLVIISKHNTACELCQPFESKVLIDDVYSGGTQADGDYMLLSEAMKLGLFHPRCRHGLGTYYPEIDGINRDYGAKYTSDTVADYGKYNEAHVANMVQKYTRLVHGCSDPDNIKKYTAKLREWQGKGGIIEEEPPTEEFTPAKTIKEAEGFAKEKLGFDVVIYGKTDLDVANEINRIISEIKLKYPQINVDRIVESPKSAKFELAMHKTNYVARTKTMTAGTLELGRWEHHTLDDIKTQVQGFIKSGIKTGDYSKPLESTLYHEFAHQYGSILEAKAFPNIDEAYGEYLEFCNKKTYFKGLVKEAKKTAKSEGWEFKTGNISKYAAKNESEAFAEAFADINLSKNPKKESLLLMKIVGII